MAKRGKRYRLTRATMHCPIWRVASHMVWINGDPYVLMAAIHDSAREIKYMIANATTATERRVLEVAFRRATIELPSDWGSRRRG